MPISGLSTSIVGLSVLLLAPVARASEIFNDGFEECGLGRWASPSVSAPPEVFSGLTPALLAEALGACAPSLISAEFRLADGSVPGDPTLVTLANEQSAIFRTFGTGGVAALAGGTMAALSSGRARDEDGPSYVNPYPGTSYSRAGGAPAAYLAQHGGVLPTNSCAPGLTSANDSIALRLVFLVPTSAVALRFDWIYASADYPEFVCNGGTAYVDFFLALAQGTSPGLPADRNVALVGGNPVSAAYVPFAYCTGCPLGTAALAGTGYTGRGMTAWHTAEVPVVADETLTLDLMTFDVGDNVINSIVLLDGLRWVTQ